MTTNPWGTQPVPPGPLPPQFPPTAPPGAPPAAPLTGQPPPGGQRPRNSWARILAVVAAILGVLIVAVAAFFIGRGTDDAAAPTAPTTAASVKGTALATQKPSQSVRPSASPLLSKVSPSPADTPSAPAAQTAQAPPPPPPPPPPPQQQPEPDLPFPDLAFPPPADAIVAESFSVLTPSGSVVCHVNLYSMECATGAWTFTPPVQCDPDMTFIMSMVGTEPVERVCNYSDGGFVESVLPGQSFTNTVYACTVEQDAVSCWHTTTGNGFYLSSSRQSTY